MSVRQEGPTEESDEQLQEIVTDTVDATVTIGGNEWAVVEATVELSTATTPNYVDMIILPTAETIPTLPDDVDNLVGQPFEITANTDLISNRDTNAEERTLLFKGSLANISQLGDGSFEALAYDPSQQVFNKEDSQSVWNQTLTIETPKYNAANEITGPNDIGGTEMNPRIILASDLLQQVVEKAGIQDTDIELKQGGVTVEGKNGSFTGGYDRRLYFSNPSVKISKLLDELQTRTESEWWFDNEGTFHFGPPRPTKHELTYITDTTAGLTTPPYQSVRVLYSGLAATEGHARDTLEPDDLATFEAALSQTENGIKIVENETVEPVFEYKNASISTPEEAKSAARSILQDLRKQQRKGKVTVVGFPEVQIFDGIKMPNTDNQPMGGEAYGVTKVVHKLNGQDGFVTDIHVGGPIGVTKTVVEEDGDTLVTQPVKPP